MTHRVPEGALLNFHQKGDTTDSGPDHVLIN